MWDKIIRMGRVGPLMVLRLKTLTHQEEAHFSTPWRLNIYNFCQGVGGVHIWLLELEQMGVGWSNPTPPYCSLHLLHFDFLKASRHVHMPTAPTSLSLPVSFDHKEIHQVAQEERTWKAHFTIAAVFLGFFWVFFLFLFYNFQILFSYNNFFTNFYIFIFFKLNKLEFYNISIFFILIHTRSYWASAVRKECRVCDKDNSCTFPGSSIPLSTVTLLNQMLSLCFQFRLLPSFYI